MQLINEYQVFKYSQQKHESGGFLGTLLASIGILMAVDLRSKIQFLEKVHLKLALLQTDGKEQHLRIGFPKFPPPFWIMLSTICI